MCGIVGIVAGWGAEVGAQAKVDDALRAMLHRGPDGAGHYRSDVAALGQRRLSIIDVEHGEQPMYGQDGTAVVVYNGEIWNHAALRADLSARGHTFATECDTEVLVHGYEEWGEDLVSRLDGMFAFAIWDESRQRLLLARDRVGKKPLYLAYTGDRLIFGSDARSVLIAGDIKPEVERSAIPTYLFQRYVSAPRTLFRGVQRLPPGHIASYDRTRLEVTRYWQLGADENEDLSPSELRDLIACAVRKRLMSDVPIGVFLSGGVDSSAILALATQMSPDRLASFTVGFRDPVFDERPLAALTARHLGSDHRELVLDENSFLEALPRLAWYRDEPIAEASEIPLLLLAEFAKRDVKVVLTGDGGDELFGGYPKYRADRFIRRGGVPAVLAIQAAARLRSALPSHRQLSRAVNAAAIRDDVVRWASWFGSFSPTELDQLLVGDLREAASPRALTASLEAVLEPFQHLGPENRMLLGDMMTYLPDNMLLRSDKVLMAASLEGRMPLLDGDILKRAIPLREADAFGWRVGKRMLRRAVAELIPEEVRRGVKRGFPVPIERFTADGGWVRSLLLSERTLERRIFQPEALSCLVEATGDRTRQHKLFVLASLELWLRANVDHVRLQPPQSIDELTDGDAACQAKLRNRGVGSRLLTTRTKTSKRDGI